MPARRPDTRPAAASLAAWRADPFTFRAPWTDDPAALSASPRDREPFVVPFAIAPALAPDLRSHGISWVSARWREDGPVVDAARVAVVALEALADTATSLRADVEAAATAQERHLASLSAEVDDAARTGNDRSLARAHDRFSRAFFFYEDRAPLPPASRADLDTLEATRVRLVHDARRRSELVAALRAHLSPSTPPPEQDREAAERWLRRTYTGSEPVRRSEVGRSYYAAGSPGGLDSRRLYALASRLWGAPVRRNGHMTYKP
ncbi:MAG: hypothetical protein ACTHQ3_04690 [Motilibacteraceae bacterium]